LPDEGSHVAVLVVVGQHLTREFSLRDHHNMSSKNRFHEQIRISDLHWIRIGVH